MTSLKRNLSDSSLNQQGSNTRPRRDSLDETNEQQLKYPQVNGGKMYRAPAFHNSALKYYVDPPIGADLTYRIEHWIRREEERGRLDGLLRACLHKQAAQERRRASVATWRGVMTKILVAPYENRDGWDMNVMFVDGTLYFEEHKNAEKLQEKENDLTGKNRHQTYMYMGYAFESYCTSSEHASNSEHTSSNDKTRARNGWGGDVDTNVQWCSVVKTKLGDNRLVIGGEVDCVRGQYVGQPRNFVELKTSVAIRHKEDEVRFERKLLKFYFQSFLLGVPEIIVGFRTPNGRLTTVQLFKTVELPRLVRGKPHAWDPNLCLDWGNRFIHFVKSSVTAQSASAAVDTTSSESLVWRVTFKPNDGVDIHLLDEAGVQEVVNNEDRVGFLPTWYWDAVRGPSTGETSAIAVAPAAEEQ